MIYVIYNPRNEKYFNGYSPSRKEVMWMNLPQNATLYESEERAEENALDHCEVKEIGVAIEEQF